MNPFRPPAEVIDALDRTAEAFVDLSVSIKFAGAFAAVFLILRAIEVFRKR